MGGSRMAARREGAGTLEGNPLTGRRQRDRTLLGGVGHRAPIGDEWAMGRGGGGGGGGEQERSEHLEASQVWLEQAEAQRSHRTSDASPTMPPTPARPVRSIRSPLPPPNETNLPPGARGHPAQREQWRRARRPGTGARGDGRGRRGCLEEGRGE
ncbi:unnamed protein product [Prorocentrum cordatum]|uniref:Uncharacterized protein n=1 Tax=Prorocentrum cordatum TaxID=2364126 RepID=A0ABN9UHU0_9DINO|nr:unnamed protein product [Polarella glacialis]